MSPAASLNRETRPRAITDLGSRGRVPADGEAAGRINSCMSSNRICHLTKADLISHGEKRSRPPTQKTAVLLCRTHFSREHVGIFRASIARRPNDDRFTEAGGSKLRKKGAAFLGSSDSSEPILFARLNF
jgi:hypothetical protein